MTEEDENESASRDERRPRVLLAEDDSEMRRLVADALRAERCDVVELGDGTELVALLAVILSSREGPRVDLLVTDIRMPGCNALELLEGLRRSNWSVPVVLMTAFGDDDTRARAVALGAVLLDKPFRIPTLLGSVRTLLSKREDQDGARPRNRR